MNPEDMSTIAQGAHLMRLRDKATFNAETGAGGGHEGGKPRMDLLPFAALEEVAKVFGYGEEKYSESGGSKNWKLGLEHSSHIASALRHTSAMMQGEELDQYSGLSHAAHAIARLMMYLESHIKGYGEYDIEFEETDNG